MKAILDASVALGAVLSDEDPATLPYLDLALELELPLATLDRGLRSAARVHGLPSFQPPSGA